MNTNINKIAVTSALAVSSLLLSVGLVGAATFTPLTNQIGIGSTGANVTNLQTFLASNSDIYPAGLVTGYYGLLTEAAVKQFQLSYGIPMVGNVGPMTLGAVNNIMNRGYGIDVYGPTIYGVSVQKTSNSATFNSSTNGNTTGKVFYSTSPFTVREAIGNFTAPSITGGSITLAPVSQTGQNIIVSNLQSNMPYYYIIQATDASGNVSVTNTATFTTN